MANYNKVILIGRFVRDPEMKTFANGNKIAKFSFVVSNKKKNPQNGEVIEDPCYIDCEAFNRGDHGVVANIVEQYCRKGSEVQIEGRLFYEQWDDKTTGAKRSRHKLVVDSLQLLGKREPQQQEQASQPQQDRYENEIPF